MRLCVSGSAQRGESRGSLPVSELLSVCVYQFLVVDFVLGALSVPRLHPQLRNSFHLHSSHWQGTEKAACIMDGDSRTAHLLGGIRADRDKIRNTE